jgi:type II secretory pathway pseudopilin PulG
VKDESGMTLIELLVAMLVMTFGIMALVAVFTSGILALERGAKTTTAGALADKQMETYRQATFASIPVTGAQTAVVTSGSNGGTYWLQATITWTCPIGTLTGSVTGPPPTCANGTGALVRPVKLVSIDVRDTSSTGKLLVNESSTFDSSTG